MNDIQIIEKARLIRNIEKDFDFENLEISLKSPNIFRILKISNTEIRHSNFLSWLLNPKESHNLNEVFLKHFLLNNSVDFDYSDLQNAEIRREWKNIDLLIIYGQTVVCIENKVDSKEHSNQLTRYKNIINEKFKNHQKHFIYLTPNSDIPSDEHYESASYRQISEIIENILEIHERILTPEVKQYIIDYNETLKIDIMKEHELNNLAIKIYSNHKEAFDFVFDNKPDLANDFKKYFENKVLKSGWEIGSPNKGCVRFLTKSLKEIMPSLDGWKEKEAFSFEVDYYWDHQKRINFTTAIAPGKNSDIDIEIKSILNNCLSPIQKQIPKGKKWLVHFREKWKFELQAMSEKDDDEIYKEIDKFWSEIEKIVNSVEKEILKKKNDLLIIKQMQDEK